jgi:hypothetical protein
MFTIMASNFEEAKSSIREFPTGAIRDNDLNKPDYEGFLSPLVIERYGAYMNKHRLQPNGTIRASDNWQLGIPKDAYIKSAWRHFLDWWKQHRGWPGQDTLEESICALIFNASGYLDKILRDKATRVPLEIWNANMDLPGGLNG